MTATKKGLAASAAIVGACAACCAVPIIAAGGGAAVAGPVGIGAVLLAGLAGLWAWLRRRGKSQQD